MIMRACIASCIFHLTFVAMAAAKDRRRRSGVLLAGSSSISSGTSDLYRWARIRNRIVPRTIRPTQKKKAAACKSKVGLVSTDSSLEYAIEIENEFC
jgi:hypothetical protein